MSVPDSPSPIESRLLDVSTDELVDELRRRAEVFYLIMRPLAKERYEWRQLIEMGKTSIFAEYFQDEKHE